MVIFCCCSAGGSYAPHDDIESKPFCYRELLNYQTIWYFCDQVRNEECRSSVREVVAFEVQIFVDSHNGSILSGRGQSYLSIRYYLIGDLITLSKTLSMNCMV